MTASNSTRVRFDATDPDHELQCLDCYAIFASEEPPAEASCSSCGSGDVTPW